MHGENVCQKCWQLYLAACALTQLEATLSFAPRSPHCPPRTATGSKAARCWPFMAASKFPTLSLSLVLSFSLSLARFLCRLSASTHHRHTHHSDRLPSVVYQSCVLGGTAGSADRWRTCMPTAATPWHEDHREPKASATGPAAGGAGIGKNTRIVVLFCLCNCSQPPV